MSKIRRLISVLLVVIMVLAYVPAEVLASNVIQSGTCGELTWTIDGEGTMEFFGSGYMQGYNCDWWTPTPWESYKDRIYNVIINDGATSIGSDSFYGCSNLTSVIIPDSVTNIGFRAFAYCDKLTTVTIPAQVSSIGENEPYGTAFMGCENLKEIIVSEDNKTYSSYNGALYSKNKDELIQYPGGLNKFVIPESVTIIGKYAVSDCVNLINVTIPDNVTHIKESAFRSCTNIKTLNLPDSLDTIGASAFYNCQSLKEVKIQDSVTIIGRLSFGSCNALTDVYYEGTEDEWSRILIGDGNECLTNAENIHFQSAQHTQHSFGEWEVVKTATCTEAGSEKRTCACGETETREIAKVSHKEETTSGKAATCTEKGLTDGKHCSVCNAVIVAQTEIPATGHTETLINVKEATEKEEGYTGDKVCSVCGEVLEKGTVIPVKETTPDNKELVGKKFTQITAWGGEEKWEEMQKNYGINIPYLLFETKNTGEFFFNKLSHAISVKFSYSVKDNIITITPVNSNYTLGGYSEMKVMIRDDETLVVTSVTVKQGQGSNITEANDIFKSGTDDIVPDTNTPQIVVETKEVSAGKEFEVNVSVQNNKGFIQMVLVPKFSEGLKLKEVKAPEGLEVQMGRNLEIASGSVADFDKDGTIATLVFEAVNAEGTYDVGFVLGEAVNLEEKDIAFEIEAGKVTIKEEQPSELECGDTDGDGTVTAKDATQILRYINGKSSVFTANGADTALLEKIADVDGDGSVTAKDATQILRHINGKTSVFDKLVK